MHKQKWDEPEGINVFENSHAVWHEPEGVHKQRASLELNTRMEGVEFRRKMHATTTTVYYVPWHAKEC